MSLIVKITLLALTLLALAAHKSKHFVHLSFNSNLQFINGISSDLQKLLKYLNDTSIVAFFDIPFVPSASILYYIYFFHNIIKRFIV